MAVSMSVTSRAGQVPMGIRLNRFKEACTWVLAYETTPIVIPLKNCYSHNFFGLLTDFFGHFLIQVAVSLPKPVVSLFPKRQYHSRFGSETETATNL
jgi:hypothetical protein